MLEKTGKNTELDFNNLIEQLSQLKVQEIIIINTAYLVQIQTGLR